MAWLAAGTPSARGIADRTKMSDDRPVRGNDFIRQVRRYAAEHGQPCEWRADRGKGSHGLLTLGSRRTVVRNPRDELKKGTLYAMLKQLGLTLHDLG
jgi:mRNA interferase HicA